MSRPLLVRELRKRYGDLPVLGGIDLEIGPSEIVAVVGPSGCGKSTLLRLAAGLDTRYHGEIRVGDEKIHLPVKSMGRAEQVTAYLEAVAEMVDLDVIDRGYRAKGIADQDEEDGPAANHRANDGRRASVTWLRESVPRAGRKRCRPDP